MEHPPAPAASRASRRSLLALAAAAVVALVAIALAVRSCTDRPDEPVADGAQERQADITRMVAAAFFAEDKIGEARKAIAPLVEVESPDPRDLVRAAIIDLELSRLDAARPLLERARELAPDLPEVPYNLGVLAHDQGDLEAALEHFRRAHELAPDDFPTKLKYANALTDLDELDEAERLYRELKEVGLDFGGSWYLTTIYKLSQVLAYKGDDASLAESQELLDEFKRLRERGLTVPDTKDLRQGNLGRLLAPPMPDLASAEPGAAPPFAAFAPVAGPSGIAGIARATLYDDVWVPAPEPGAPSTVGASGVVAWGADGIWYAELGGDGAPRVERLWSDPAPLAWPFDLGEDGSAFGDLDFWVADGAALTLLVNREGALERSPLSPPPFPGPIADVTVVDFDHDGDLDVLVVGAFGARLLRNDGASVTPDGAFVDASAEASLPADRAFTWSLVEDFDTDQDVDLLMGGPSGTYLADSLRGGRFADASERVASLVGTEHEPLVADLDGDGRPDLWTAAAPGRLWKGLPSGRFEAVDLAGNGGPTPGAPAVLADVDLDGALDLVWSADGVAARAQLALGVPGTTLVTLEAAGEHAGTGGQPLAVEDFDGDGAMDLARVRAGALEIARGLPTDAGSLRLALRGFKDNRRGVGAVVELLAGPVYRRAYWRGEATTFGLGGEDEVDVLRVTWPNGVVQWAPLLPAGAQLTLLQVERLTDSCPFLYTWNGERYEFISDVLGITPLGLPLAPGRMVAPDHDEYVLVRGDQLAPRDGVYEIQITEELREVTYLDRVRLDVVDHPAGTEIWPNERFTFPPFPEPHTHVTERLYPPASAVDGDGRDWTEELGAIDAVLAVPFERLGGQLLGLATPHVLELRFDPGVVRDAEKLRLFMTGWLVWSNASVNMATARTPGVDFIPPVLQVPDPTSASGWRDAGPPVGFPAGKTKTMVIDVDGLLDAQDPRLRIRCTLRLYWDAIRLATDGDDAPLVVTELDPTSADLWERGFSEPIMTHPEHGLEWFEWGHETEHPRWNQHPGMYTRYGDVLPLLGAIDDRFVILGAGDALTVRFDASALPPLRAGWTRDYLVFFDGWAKDRDPNTIEALYVEPLPFHGMSGYPYGPDESYPDDAEHRAYRREWNTRPAKRWIEPLAPGARSLAPALAREAHAPALVRGAHTGG